MDMPSARADANAQLRSGFSYLGDAPTAGHDVAFYLGAAAAGTILGPLAAAFVRVRPGHAGNITARAGAAFLSVWLAAIGGRMVFAWAATQTSFGTTVGRFSREQLITGPQAWRAAFVIMALAMVLSRLLGARPSKPVRGNGQMSGPGSGRGVAVWAGWLRFGEIAGRGMIAHRYGAWVLVRRDRRGLAGGVDR